MATPSQRNWGRAEILGSGIRLVGGPRGWQLKERDFRTMGSTQELCLLRMLEELISSGSSYISVFLTAAGRMEAPLGG